VKGTSWYSRTECIIRVRSAAAIKEVGFGSRVSRQVRQQRIVGVVE